MTQQQLTARVFLIFLLAPASLSLADAIVITKAMTASTIAEIFIEESSVRVELEIGGRDLEGFRNLMPDDVYGRLGHPADPWAGRLARFFAEDLTLRLDGGPPLPGRLLEIASRPRLARDEITGEPMPAAPVPAAPMPAATSEQPAETVVFAVLEYPFTGRPATLAVKSPMDERGFPNASIGFITYHLGLPVMDYRYLGHEEVLDLDWQDPWYSRFRNRNLRRQYDAPMNVFLYVEPYEVRTEVIVRPVDLEQWVDLGLEGRRTIPVEMQYDLKQRVAEFLAGRQNVRIDGQQVEPTLDRINFLRRTLRNSTVIDPPEELDAISATLGVIFVYPTDGLPQEARLTWDLFSDRIRKVPAAATDEVGPLRFFLQPDDNVLWWKNVLKNPTLTTLVEIEPPPGLLVRLLARAGWLFGAALLGVVAVQAQGAVRGRGLSRRALVAAAALLILIGVSAGFALPARINDDKAGEIVGALLHNVYRAFDFREEGAIYDVLDRSVTGDLLTQIYLETRRGLELASQGGARAKVKEIDLVEVEARKLGGRGGFAQPGFAARCVWTVSGAVGHWGHVHRRSNRYEAELTVQPVAGVWKVTQLELLQEERI